MKTEHRHELATNSLARNLEIWGERLRPHASAILLGVGALVGAYAVATAWNSRTASQEQRAWETYERAILDGDVDYSGVRQAAQNEELAGSRMQEWAYVAWADRQLLHAVNRYLVSRQESKDEIADAAAIYEQYTGGSVDPTVRSRAQLGLARVAELQGQVDEAKRLYMEVEGPMQPVAEARLKDLETKGDEIKDTTAWLATAEATRPTPPSGAGQPGARPAFDASLPVADQPPGPLQPSQDMLDSLGGSTATDALDPRYLGDAAADDPFNLGAQEAADAAAPATETPAADATEGAPTDEPSAETDSAAPAPSDGEAPAPQTDGEKASEASPGEQPAPAEVESEADKEAAGTP